MRKSLILNFKIKSDNDSFMGGSKEELRFEMDTRGRAGFAVGLCPCQSVTRHLTLYFISALLLLVVRPQIADGNDTSFRNLET